MATKRQIYGELMTHDPGESVEDSKRRIGELMRTADFKEGVAAMAQKREPKFQPLPAVPA